jgi:hypothetical protein
MGRIKPDCIADTFSLTPTLPSLVAWSCAAVTWIAFRVMISNVREIARHLPVLSHRFIRIIHSYTDGEKPPPV